MESTANLHHHQHQLQDQLLASSSSSSSSSLSIIPSYFGLGSTHAWSPNISLNNSCNINYNNPRILNGVSCSSSSSSQASRSDCEEKNTNSSSIIMLQDHHFHSSNYEWNGSSDHVNTGSNNFFTQPLHHDAHEKIKQEILISSAHQSFPKFTEILNNNEDSDLNDLTHKLLIKTLISSGCQINGSDHLRPGPHFSQIYPSINISNWNNHLSSDPVVPPPPSFSNSLDLNLQSPADMFASSSGNFSQDNFGIFKETLSDLHDQIHLPLRTGSLPCNITPSKMTVLSSEVSEPKRPCDSMEARLNQQSPPPPLKKSRLDSRASCPPFKVRKEKLGDRIAALQQLVAPFGKTDTASVLMEAIGYIKFLQNQVETLSVPYMKPASNKTTKPTHRSSVENGNEGGKNRDLRSRGLCLVPLGCLSYVTGDGGGGIWPPSGFNGGTS